VHTENLVRGNAYLDSAAKHSRDFRLLILSFLLIASFALLFLDYYYDWLLIASFVLLFLDYYYDSTTDGGHTTGGRALWAGLVVANDSRPDLRITHSGSFWKSS
jgi:hypothetical protein